MLLLYRCSIKSFPILDAIKKLNAYTKKQEDKIAKQKVCNSFEVR